MCKIFTLTNTSKIKKLNKTVNVIAKELAKYEQDGFGYTIQGKDGIYGERILDSDDFSTAFQARILDMPWLETNYNRFGTKSAATGAGMFHGRTSTNAKTLINTHPINKHNWSLIHNGVVSNHGSDYTRITSNDTEHLVKYLGTEGIKAIEANITGYYAITAISPTGELHIIKDSIANLMCAYIDTIDSYVYATTEALIKDICKSLNWTHSIVSAVKSNTYLIYKGNELVSNTTFTPRGSSYAENKYSVSSLGYDVECEDYFNGWTRETHSTKKHTDLVSVSKGPIDYDSEELFFNEVDNLADSSYTFFDYNHNQITLDQFQDLDDDSKLYCVVVRGDGTIVDPTDYYTDKLYQGAS